MGWNTEHMNSKSLREERAGIAKQMNEIVSRASQQKEWSPEDNEKYEKMNADQERLRSLIEKIENQEKLNADFSAVRSAGPGREEKEVSANHRIAGAVDEETQAWRSYLLGGEKSMVSQELETLRALSNASSASGGYAAPATPTSNFVEILQLETPMRLAPVQILRTEGGNDIPMATFNDTRSSATHGDDTAENSDMDEDQDPTFGIVTVKAFNFDSKIVPISEQLLEDSVIPVEQLVNKSLAKRVGFRTNYLYCVGNGTTQPQGITVGAGNSGVLFPRNLYESDHEGSVEAWHKFLDMKATVIAHANKPGFGAIVSPDFHLQLQKMTDQTGRPLWHASTVDGSPDKIAGVKIYVNADMPAVATSGRSIVMGDLDQFLIRDVNSLRVKRLNELYAKKKQIGFVCYLRTDSRVLDSTALKYATIAADEYLA